MKKRANPDSEQNIRRIDTKPRAKKQTHGFQVHFLRRGNTITRLFSDSGYGGKEGARRAARKFRNAEMGKLPERVFRGPSAKKSKPKKPAKVKKSAKARKPAKSRKPAKRSKTRARR
jgi:hypothetical protein